MARRQQGRTDLTINVGGNVTPLRLAMKAGQSALAELARGATDVQAEVSKAMANMAANAPSAALQVERSFQKSFDEIRRNAQAVMSAPNNGGALEILNAAGKRQAAEAAEREAAALRQVADAAVKVNRESTQAGAATQILAVRHETAAQEAAQYATALRAEAQALDLVEAELVGATGAQQRFGQQQGKVVATTGQARFGMQQLGMQLNDVATMWALGARPMQIFASQSGQVLQAMQLMGGEGNKFLNFMRGPWGVIGTVGVIALTPLIAKLFETKDEVGELVDKMREQADQARLNDRANDIWESSLDGLIAKTRELRKEQEKQLKTDRERRAEDLANKREENAQAKEDERRLRRALPRAAERVGAAERDFNLANSLPGGARENAGAVAAATAKLQAARAEVGRLAEELNKAQLAAAETGAAIANFETFIARDEALALSDPIEAIRRRYEELGRAAETAALGNDKLRSSLSTTLADLKRKEQLELDEERKRQSGSGASDRQSGRQVDFSDARSIAEAAGLQVNSAYRSTADQARLFNDPSVNRPGNPVARPGTSAHEGAKGRWALDIQFAPGLTAGKVRQVFADQGVSLSTVLKEKGHFHVEGSRSQAAAAEKADTRAADRRVDQNDAFAGQMARLDEELLSAKMELVTDADQQLAYAKQQVDADLNRLKLAVQNDVNDGRLREEQGKEIVAKAEAVALQRKANIFAKDLQERMEQSLRDQQDAQAQAAQFKIDELGFQASIARTAGTERDLRLQMLDILYDQKKLALQQLKADADRLGKTADAARIQADINELARQKARDKYNIEDGTKSPMEAYKDRLPKTLADVTAELEKIQVRGLQALEDDLVSATTKALGLKGALGEVAEGLIRLAFQILQSSALNGINIGQLLGFGGGRAHGGPVNDNEMYLVGERGPELFIPGASGTIIPNHVLEAARAPSIPRSVYGRGGGGSGGGSDRGPVVQNFNFPNSDADSFRRSESQVARSARRRMGLR